MAWAMPFVFGNNLPGPSDRVGLSVENDFFEGKCLRWSEEQIEVFEGLSKDTTLHGVALFFRYLALKTRSRLVCLAVLNEVCE
jgi:hypothetical protein